MIRSLNALALSECFEAYFLKISSLPVIIPEASLSEGGSNPSCTKYHIIYDIGPDVGCDIRYDIGYDIRATYIRYDIGYDFIYEMLACMAS